MTHEDPEHVARDSHREEVIALVASGHLAQARALCDAAGVPLDLSGAQLFRANLYRADLRGAQLVGTRLMWASLVRADLTGADLRGADLRGADLHGACFRGADLRGANLGGARICDTDLEDVRQDSETTLPEDFDARWGHWE